MRKFHEIKPDYEYVFHMRNDFTHVGARLGVSPIGSRSATVTVLLKGSVIAYGISRCHWSDQFNRKRAYRMALGRAQLALGGPGAGGNFDGPLSASRHIHDFAEMPEPAADKDVAFARAQALAKDAMRILNDWASKIDRKTAMKLSLDKNKSHA